jgi:hypothetical protein
VNDRLSTQQVAWILDRSPGTRDLERLIDELNATNEAELSRVF